MELWERSNGTENDDRPNHFNDLRIIIAFNEAFRPVIEGIYLATTEPGFYYTDNPMNAKGAARIAFGQYTAWQVGAIGATRSILGSFIRRLSSIERNFRHNLITTY